MCDLETIDDPSIFKLIHKSFADCLGEDVTYFGSDSKICLLLIDKTRDK